MHPCRLNGIKIRRGKNCKDIKADLFESTFIDGELDSHFMPFTG